MATATEPFLTNLLTIKDVLEHLGGISPGRVRFRPNFGTATVADLIAVNASKQGIFELVDGVLVEKPMGKLESCLAAVIIAILHNFALPLSDLFGEMDLQRP
jgi:hypothetical protein